MVRAYELVSPRQTTNLMEDDRSLGSLELLARYLLLFDS